MSEVKVIETSVDKIKVVLKKYTMDQLIQPIEEAIKGKSPAEIKQVVFKLVEEKDIATFKQGYSSALTLITGKLGMSPEWMIPKFDLEKCYELVCDVIRHVGL